MSKEKLLQMLKDNPAIGVVGRVEEWLKNSESRYPVSCTVLSVEDSMEGENGIEYSWVYVSKALRYGAGCALDLSKLRPSGDENGRGLTASGPCSFMKIYSMLNEVLRRGGAYKNGAVVCYLDYNHPDLIEFLNLSPSEIPWAKKALYVDKDWLSSPYLSEILYAVRSGTVWLAKKTWWNTETNSVQFEPTNKNDVWQDRLFSNVCLEILISSNATCCLSHLNLGQSRLQTLIKDSVETMTFLCELHAITGAGRDNYYLDSSIDRQVGMGVFGLANYLANYNIKYIEFVDCLEDFLNTIGKVDFEKEHSPSVIAFVSTLYEAFQEAAKVASSYKMERAFTIAPCASVSYRNHDLHGFVTTPEISPPIAHPVTKVTQRDSSTFGVQEYQYPLNCEVASEVGWETYFRLVHNWQRLMNTTGLAHSISHNIWDTCVCDEEWAKEWNESAGITTYYRMLVNQNFVDKSDINSNLDDAIFLEDDDFFLPVDDLDETSDDDIPSGFCSINKKGECSSCAE